MLGCLVAGSRCQASGPAGGGSDGCGGCAKPASASCAPASKSVCAADAECNRLSLSEGCELDPETSVKRLARSPTLMPAPAPAPALALTPAPAPSRQPLVCRTPSSDAIGEKMIAVHTKRNPSRATIRARSE
mmetsp:Transcript_7484/g.23633  ORF Transcript_7484/g.23633 Transcript_7484/m.23633 type:complete len:132 (+) Transcript_7484:723-1118(+)